LLQFGAFLWKGLLIRGESVLPILLRLGAFLNRLAKEIDCILGKIELVHRGPAKRFLSGLQFLFAQRVAMRLKGVLLLGAAVTNVGMRKNQRWTIRLRPRFLDCLRHVLGIVAVLDVARMPAIRFETLSDVLCKTQTRSPRERDMILVVKKNQFAKLQMAGQRCRLLADAFH